MTQAMRDQPWTCLVALKLFKWYTVENGHIDRLCFEQNQKCLSSSHFLTSSFQIFGWRFHLSLLWLAWGTPLSCQTVTEIFVPWVMLKNNIGPLTSGMTGGPWVSTRDPVNLISHGYVYFNMCSNATDAVHRNKEFELLRIKSHRKEK